MVSWSGHCRYTHEFGVVFVGDAVYVAMIVFHEDEVVTCVPVVGADAAIHEPENALVLVSDSTESTAFTCLNCCVSVAS